MTDAEYIIYQHKLGVKQMCVAVAILIGSVAFLPFAESLGLSDEDAAILFFLIRVAGLAFSGYGCCNVARSKNLSPHSYGALGFFLPPIGMVVVLSQRRKESPVDDPYER